MVFTSILQADRSPLRLAEEHRATAAELRASGLGWVLLRNGWYSENLAGSVPLAVKHGAVIGRSGTGKVSAASRADFAEAAAVLADPAAHLGQTYELAGDVGFTKAELAAEIAAQSGKPVVYADMPEADYAAALTQAGVPGPFAQVLADSDVGQSKGALEADGQVLSGLIGRPTQPMPEMVAPRWRAERAQAAGCSARPFRAWKIWVKVAAPRIGISRFRIGIDSGSAIRMPASQMVPPWRARSCLAPARPMRRIAARVKYSRPSRKPFSA